jgi:multiple sugar transport system permease protein
MAVSGKSKFSLSSVLINIAVVFLIIFATFPLLWTAYTSLRVEMDIIKHPNSLMFSNLSFDAYGKIWKGTDFPALLQNSVVTSLMTMIMSLTLGTLAGYALSRASFKGKSGVLLVYLLVRVIPGVLLLIPIYLLMQKLNLLDTSFGLALAYTTFTLPAAVWLMKGFFDSLPVDLENAARIDGCSRMGALWRIVLPLVLPGMAATGTLVAIEAWNDVLFALMITSTNEARTWPVGMKLLIGEFQLPWAQLTATAMLSLIPVLIGFSFVGKKMVAGLTAGGVKE